MGFVQAQLYVGANLAFNIAALAFMRAAVPGNGIDPSSNVSADYRRFL